MSLLNAFRRRPQRQPLEAEPRPPRWIDEHPDRYGGAMPGDYICIRRPTGVHFIRLRLEGARWPENETVCGEPLLKSEWDSSPYNGVVDCPNCLLEMEHATP